MKWKINIFFIFFILVFVNEEYEETEEIYEELIRKIYFVISEEGIWIDIDRKKFNLILSLNNIMKAFRIIVANKSEENIMEHF